MPAMTKRVNVRATVAVRNTNPPIYGTYKNIIMTTGDILKCLTKRATVDEILPDGSTIRLNYKNYYTDNGAGLDAKGEIKIIKPKQPPVVKKTAPVAEKPTADISFNENPMANAAETAEEPPVILVTADDGETKDMNVEVEVAVNTENAVKEDSTIAATEEKIGNVETTEADIPVDTESTVEDDKETQVAEADAVVENTETETTASANKSNKQATAIERKPATTSSKKKSTSNKKKK